MAPPAHSVLIQGQIYTQLSRFTVGMLQEHACRQVVLQTERQFNAVRSQNLRLGSARSVVDFLKPNVTTVKIITDHSQAVLCFLVISMDLVQIVITDPHLGAPSEKVFQYVTDM